MLSWIPYAFVRFTFFLIAGIVLCLYFPLPGAINLILILLTIAGMLFVAAYLFRTRLPKTINPGLVALPLLTVIGFLLVSLRTESNDNRHFIHFDEDISYYKVTITSHAEEKKSSWKETGEVTEIKTESGWRLVRGKVLLYFNKTEFNHPFHYGDVLLIKGKPQRVAAPSNPYEFDYKKFLSFRNIYHQHFIKDSNVAFIEHDPPNKVRSIMFKARTWSMNIIHSFVSGEREQAIASALVLGVTDNLDEEILQAYAGSGAMHVLAVSGLHIGILYAIILVVLAPLKRISSGTWIIALISVTILWCYAFITGLSPSVLRAVTMFSFIALGKPFQRNSNIYNTLALSAFCLLLYDPYLIMSVGFQLSYLAVIGIVYLYPRFILMWAPSSWLMSHVWKITCVSLAAQIATFPLGLLYFHQFPVYFLVANLFVIPLSFLVLLIGLTLVTISFIAPLAELTGALLTYVIKLLNSVVLITEKIPGSLIQSVHLTTLSCWMLMLLIFCVILMFHFRKFWLLYPCLVLAILFSLLHWKQFQATKDENLIVYNVRNHSAIEILENGQSYHFSDSALLKNPSLADFQMKSNRAAHAIQSVFPGNSFSFVRNLKGCRLIQWNNISMLQVMDKDFSFSRDLPVNYLIITNNALERFDDIEEKIDCHNIILDSSNSREVAERLMHDAKQYNRSMHSVLHHGAFVAKL